MLLNNKKCAENHFESHIYSYRILLALIWSQYTILAYVIQVFRMLPIIGVAYTWIIPILKVFAIAFALPYLVKRIKLQDIMFYLVSVSVVLLSLVIHPENESYLLEHMWSIVAVAVPMYFIGVTYEHEYVKNDLFWLSLAGVVFMFVYQIYYISSGRVVESDNMDAAYKVLPSALYLVYWACEKKNIRYWSIAVAAMLITFIYGTRGPILICIIFPLTYLLFDVIKSRSVAKTAVFILLAALGIWIVAGEQMLINVAEFLADRFSEIGFSTRIFDFFIEGEITTSHGRERITAAILEAISQNPLWGYGVMGDWRIAGVYAHNIFLEMWCQFGIFAGTLLLGVIIAIPVYALWKCRKNTEFGFLLMLVCMVFIKLMISSSVIFEPYFFFMLGVAVSVIRKRDFKKYEKNVKKAYF